MGHKEHKQHAPRQVGIGVISVSTSRTPQTDESGDLLAELARRGGHEVLDKRLVKDDVDQIRGAINEMGAAVRLRALLLTGGTGITGNDVTLRALEPFVETWLPGFGELFRMLSYQQIGSAAMLSRAALGVGRLGEVPLRRVFAAIPGSPEAVRLAMEGLILPELGHLVYELDR
ncbi:MAG: molybdenum cofactor biosynthesis protein MoaB [Myxococcales bacterium]|nr:molybdenum cofactor biosynthesis protein MoaB [Myxococcales bacterium]